MAVQATVLFDRPHQEIAPLIKQQMAAATSISIVTGFMTDAGLDIISGPIFAEPHKLSTLVIGAATHPGLEALDKLLNKGVPADRLYVHLGHTRRSSSKKHPVVRYHPMLHSKVYYFEMPGDKACAVVGSHNVTSFALGGDNGEAAVLLEGPRASPEFQKIREHILQAKLEASLYAPSMKIGLAWWTREFIEGLRAEIEIPVDWIIVRTLLVFAEAPRGVTPSPGQEVYFEIPKGIDQIDNLRTETHLFLFDRLPAGPSDALSQTATAHASFTCKTLGADNKQGNQEVRADWRIDGNHRPKFVALPSQMYRPTIGAGKQQVRAEIERAGVIAFEYRFDRESTEWEPVFADNALSVAETQAGTNYHDVQGSIRGWRLVKGLQPRDSTRNMDDDALRLASPESGSFLLVSVRRRQLNSEVGEGLFQ